MLCQWATPPKPKCLSFVGFWYFISALESSPLPWPSPQIQKKDWTLTLLWSCQEGWTLDQSSSDHPNRDKSATFWWLPDWHTSNATGSRHWKDSHQELWACFQLSWISRLRPGQLFTLHQSQGVDSLKHVPASMTGSRNSSPDQRSPNIVCWVISPCFLDCFPKSTTNTT